MLAPQQTIALISANFRSEDAAANLDFFCILNTPSYASLLFVKTIITPAVPNKKSSIRGRW